MATDSLSFQSQAGTIFLIRKVQGSLSSYVSAISGSFHRSHLLAILASSKILAIDCCLLQW